MSKKLDFLEKQKLVEEASKGEYILLSDGDTVHSKVKVKHTRNTFLNKECNQVFETSFANLMNVSKMEIKTKCPNCRYEVSKAKQSHTTQSFKNKVKKDDNTYKVLGEYINTDTKIKIQHTTCNHIYDIRPREWVQGNRCPLCSKGSISKKEKELGSFIKSLFDNEDDIEFNKKGLLDKSNKEIDIYIPSKNIAIEFDGIHWHSERMGKDKWWHINRVKYLSDKDITTIRVFESEWNTKQEIVKSKLKNLLGKSNLPVIHARKCYINEVNSKDKGIFLNKNHIQGNDKSTIKLGLYTKEGSRLVSIMTFCKPRVSLNGDTNKFDYELSRFASDINYNVVGGFSKLLSFFNKNYEFNSIITYADLRWSIGKLYDNNGFTFSHISDPSYWYFHSSNKDILLHRFNFRKNNLANVLKRFDNNKTEYQNMLENKYDRIWDCGNLVFVYHKEK